MPSRRKISEASGQKLRGLGGFCPQAEAKPRHPVHWSAEAEAEKFSFPFRRKIGACKIKKVKKIFLRGRLPFSAVGGGAERLDFFSNF
ncbi:MAG: hypothetical protein C0412_21070 [Flavobacterium sp.]|nr:hypothetical protein [Flavobacterium sp.]